MQTSASSIPRSPQPTINSLSPGDCRVLNENELAQWWGVSPKTLQRWRMEGRDPRYLKLSKRVSYPVEAVIEFEREALPAAQKAEIDKNLDDAIDWLKKARIKFDAALDAAYGEQARTALRDSGRDFGTA